VTYDILTQRIKQVGNLPAMPTVLSTICEALSVRTSKIDVEHVVKTISFDESLAAQCLRLANSALFRQRGDVSTVREAVMALGLWRIRDLAFSCSLPLMFANSNCVVAKEAFWRHALATGMVAQSLAKEFHTGAQEQVYLCGLLHDIGILVNGILFTEDFTEVMEESVREAAPPHLVEQRILGFTHAETGRILAELWRLPEDISNVIEHHNHPENIQTGDEIAVIVYAADLICQREALGYGYDLASIHVKSLDEVWGYLLNRFPQAIPKSQQQYTALIDEFVAKARELADHLFAPAMATR